MNTIGDIEKLVSKGFEVFPLQVNGKKPHISNFTEKAAHTVEDAKKMWVDPVMEIPQPYNIGIATTNYKEGSLLVVDVDMKDGRNGVNSLNELELNGKAFPLTMTQKTPTGGMHLVYKTRESVKQGANVLGVGLDIRSRGGYIVGAGSEIDGKAYTFSNDYEIAEAPEWMIEKCNEKTVAKRTRNNKNLKINSMASIARVTEYLRKAKVAIAGEAGDEHTFKVASRCKDLGVDEEKAFELMSDLWNVKCRPPWPSDELKIKIDNAFEYGQNEPGSDAPEADFEEAEPSEDDDVASPIEKINKEYSFVVMGGRSTILKKLPCGDVLYLQTNTFHDMLKSQEIYAGKKWDKLSEVWMASPNRSSYDRVEMLPNCEVPDDVYNLWRGFSCEPYGKDEKPSKKAIEGVAMFKEHALENVCDGDESLYHWLMGYFAHMIQKPQQKPTTALVFKGEKGVGKNALIDRIGHLFRAHYLLTSNKRYLTSSFNNHLSKLLLFVLDEAFWSGDKQAEGILKDLITGNKHLIEQKGREMYMAKNITRICIIGNEEWLTPATQDERRFAVFNVGNARRQDTKFFKKMRKYIDEEGGNRLLIQELMDFDVDTINVNKAPSTVGLLDQKIESLNLVHAWWLQSLQDGQIAEMDVASGVWPSKVSRNRMRDAFINYAKQRGIRSWLPSSSAFGKDLKKACPAMGDRRLGSREQRQWVYELPNLETSRAEFDKFIRHPVKWPSIVDEVDVFS